jgi:hypothetical protein
MNDRLGNALYRIAAGRQPSCRHRRYHSHFRQDHGDELR